MVKTSLTIGSDILADGVVLIEPFNWGLRALIALRVAA